MATDSKADFIIKSDVYALDYDTWSIYGVNKDLRFTSVTSGPAPGMVFRIEDTLFRMWSSGELERFDASWMSVKLYSSWGEANLENGSFTFALSTGVAGSSTSVTSSMFQHDAAAHSIRDPTEATGPTHTFSTAQPTQAGEEYYEESDMEGSELTSSEYDEEEDTAVTQAPLLGSLGPMSWGMQQIPFSPLLSANNDHEQTSFTPAQLEPGIDVAHQSYAVSFEHWPQDLQLIDWRHSTEEDVVNLVNFFKRQRNATRGQTKALLLCPVVGCQKAQRRPQALRVSAIFPGLEIPQLKHPS